MNVHFYEQITDEKLKFAVIVSRYQGQWVYCKHAQRDTYEMPGGHREVNETILACAQRELYEETGAVGFEIEPVVVYAVEQVGDFSYGMVFYAQIDTFETLPSFEMEQVRFFSEPPLKQTYPLIQPRLLDEVKRRKEIIDIMLLEHEEEKVTVTSSILDALPAWFGLEDSVKMYVETSKKLPMFIAKDEDQTIAFVNLKETSKFVVEVYVMGILPAYHRHGVGTRLMKQVWRYAKAHMYTYVQVKTLDPSIKDDAYLKTYHFYEKQGFVPVEVLPLWDERNPCQLMIKYLGS